jgi:outer membrane protein assembly complex protein YaeT
VSAARRLRTIARAERRLLVRSPVLATLTLSLLLASPVRAQGLGGSGLPRVAEVRVEGTRVLKPKAIKKVLKTRTRPSLAFWSQGPLFRQDFLRADIAIIGLFAALHGFLDATVSGLTEPVPGKNLVRVIYHVTEGRLTAVDSVLVRGVHVLPAAVLEQVVTTKVGQPFNPERLSADRQALTALYADHGYFPLVTGSWTRLDSTSVAVRLEVAEGPSYRVGTISIEGVTQVDSSVVRRELLLGPGDPFRRERLARSIERLYDTGLFQLVDFVPTQVDTNAAEVSFQVRVRERRHRSLEGGAGVGSAEGLRLLAGWGHGNLFGKGRSLTAETRYSFGNLHRFHNAIRYTEPWLFGTRTQGSVTPFFDQSETDFREVQFTQRRWGVGFVAKRDLSRFARATLGLDQQWSQAVSIPALSDSLLEGFERGQFFTNRVSLTWTYDGRDNVFNPTKGELFQTSGELAGKLLGGQGQFLKGTLSAARYLPVSGGASVAVRFEVGGIRPYGSSEFTLSSVPINDLFRTGGATSVRGYPEEKILGADGTGGLLLVLTNAELRFPITSILGGALFVDGGNVWSRPRDFKWRDFKVGGGLADGNQYRWSAGGGVRVRTPVGPVRFDLGYRLRDELLLVGDPPRRNSGWGYHLSLGQAF